MSYEQIPVLFNHQGKHYEGYFSPVTGAGKKSFHLSVNGRYWGQMFLAEISSGPGHVTDTKDKKYGYRFYSQSGDLDYLEDYFVSVVTEWYGNNPV